jgi:hypothetical protein
MVKRERAINQTGKSLILMAAIIIFPLNKHVMAKPHHRKGHKEHLKQFQNRTAGNTGESKAKARASSVFAIGGAVVGLIVLYLATQGDFLWAAAGGLVGGLIGYSVGKNIDKAPKR